MSTEPQWAADAWGFTETEAGCRGGVSRLRQSEVPAALRGHAFRRNQNLLRKQKEATGSVRTVNDQRTLSDLC